MQAIPLLEASKPSFTLYPKWARVLKAQPLSFTGHNPSYAKLEMTWRKVSAVKYKPEGVDYWKTPAEFFAQGGDCEDYAIAAYYLLAKQGFTDDMMEIQILDNRRQETHAVLVVRLHGKAYVLDNQAKGISGIDRLNGLTAHYWINSSATGSGLR